MVQCGTFTVTAVITESEVNVFECALRELNAAENPREVDDPDRTFQAEATIRNGNNTDVETNIDFRLNGQLIESPSVTIGANDNEDVRVSFNPAEDFGITTGQTFRVTAEQSGSITSAMRAQGRTPTVSAPISGAGGACGVCDDAGVSAVDRVRSSARAAAGAVTATTSAVTSTSSGATAAAPITAHQNITPQNCAITAVDVPPGSPMTIEFFVEPNDPVITGEAWYFLFDSNDNRVNTERIGSVSTPWSEYATEPQRYTHETNVPGSEGEYRVVVQIQGEESQG